MWSSFKWLRFYNFLNIFFYYNKLTKKKKLTDSIEKVIIVLVFGWIFLNIA